MATAQSFSLKKQLDWSAIGFRIVFLLPALLMLGLFMFFPIVETFRYSMMRASAFGTETYIGLTNYIKLFSDEDFLMGLLHVFQWAFWSVLIQIPLAFFIAFACTSYKTKTVKGLRSVYYLSNIFPSTITAMLARFLFMPASGVFVTLGTVLGLNWLVKTDFLGDTKIVFWTLFAMATWAYTGFGIIYLMANMEQIPVELSEAAKIDGANRWQYACYIVVPQISYAIRIQAILCTIGSFKLFDLPWLITSGGPGNATTTLGIKLYQDGFLNWQYGKGAAIGVVIFLLSLVFTMIQFSMQKES